MAELALSWHAVSVWQRLTSDASIKYGEPARLIGNEIGNIPRTGGIVAVVLPQHGLLYKSRAQEAGRFPEQVPAIYLENTAFVHLKSIECAGHSSSAVQYPLFRTRAEADGLSWESPQGRRDFTTASLELYTRHLAASNYAIRPAYWKASQGVDS